LFKNVKMDDVFEIILHKATSYCSKYEKCEYDVRKKMIEWHVNSSTADKIIDFLIDNEFIDHNRFVKAFVHDAIYLKKHGRIKIKQSLRQKKISETLINEVLKDIDTEHYNRNVEHLITQRFNSISITKEKKPMIVKSLYSRGFEPEITYKVLEKIIQTKT